MPACNDASSSEHSDCLTPALFDLVMQATSLETLILEEHFINATTLPYRCFPSSLKHLSMENCHMINAPVKESYFYNMAGQTPLLESLNLSGCNWFEDHSMMVQKKTDPFVCDHLMTIDPFWVQAISKCPRLKTLRLRGCSKVGTCAAYIFLSARFGFEKIEVLDLRETAVSDSEVRAFKSKPNLSRLYVDGRLHRRLDSDQLDRVSDTGLNLPEEPAPHLEVLVLSNTEVTDLTLRHMTRNMPNLKLVDLRGTRVTEPGVVRLRTEFPSLKVLCDFEEQTADLSTIPEADDWWIDRQFVRQEEVKRPVVIVTAGPSAGGEGNGGAGPARYERIEIIAVEPGMVRLRRIFDRSPQLRQQEADREQPAAEDPPPEQPEPANAEADAAAAGGSPRQPSPPRSPSPDSPDLPDNCLP